MISETIFYVCLKRKKVLQQLKSEWLVFLPFFSVLIPLKHSMLLELHDAFLVLIKHFL